MKKIEVKRKPNILETIEITEKFISKLPVEIEGHKVYAENDVIMIETLEGILKTELGSYIMIGVKKEIYAIKRDVFNEIYTVVGKDEELLPGRSFWVKDKSMPDYAKFSFKQHARCKFPVEDYLLINEVRNQNGLYILRGDEKLFIFNTLEKCSDWAKKLNKKELVILREKEIDIILL